MKTVGIIGASGYTGHELLKILKNHPDVTIKLINSRSFVGQKVSSLYQDFTGDDVYSGLSYQQINDLNLDLLFLALPNGLSKQVIKQLDGRAKLIDLSADYRFQDPKMYETIYGNKAAYDKNPWVFGLPELFRGEIEGAQLVSNPGCYVTASILAALPIQAQAERIIFDCKSGWSGAGRESTYAKNPELIKDNVIAYNLTSHRHKYEIEQFITVPLSFTPHVFNTFQGMLCTAHIILKGQLEPKHVRSLYQKFYADSPFVKITHAIPQVADTRKTNFCHIGGFEIDESNQLVVISTIDNLWKGASGQAIQNMNLMLGLEETSGLL